MSVLAVDTTRSPAEPTGGPHEWRPIRASFGRLLRHYSGPSRAVVAAEWALVREREMAARLR